MRLRRKTGETAAGAMARRFEKNYPGSLGPACMVRTQHGDAIAIRVGESLSDTWQSGDILFLWPDGEHTSVDDAEDIEILIPDLWALAAARAS